MLALRTQVIDAEVARALGRGTAQIVLLGAGYDGRSLRFGGGAVRWFEVDRPAVLADKRRRLDALGLAAADGGDLASGSTCWHDDLGAALDAAGTRRRGTVAVRLRGALRRPDPGGDGHPVPTLRSRAAPGSVLVATFSVAPEAGGAGAGAARPPPTCCARPPTSPGATSSVPATPRSSWS